jgi:hypothetical protein
LTDFYYFWYGGCLHQNLSSESDFVLEFFGALSPLLYSFALGYGPTEPKGLKLSGTHRLLICAEDVICWEGNTNTVTLLHSSSETGLEINVERTKYMTSLVTSMQDKTINMKTADRFLENVAKFRYPGTIP